MNFSSENYNNLGKARLIRIEGKVQDDEKYSGQIKVSRFTALPLEGDLSQFIKPLPTNHEDLKTRFTSLMRTVNEPNLRKLLVCIFHTKETRWKKFCNAVAADKMHHAYPGGLLEHTLEVTEIADAICKVIPSLERDFLVTCALLHDIGKLDEMEHTLGTGTYTTSGNLVGHVISGAFLVRRYSEEIADFPPTLVEAVCHMILSHQGKLDWGAARTPSFAEAQVLSQCDFISARLFQLREANMLYEGSQSVWLSGRDEGRVYVGDLGLTKTEKQNPVVQPMPVFITQPEVKPLQTFITKHLPIRGLVAAGSPEQSSEEDEETREVTLPNNGADYLLRVTGDSMVDAGIAPDDLLFVKAQNTAVPGEIVIANLASHGDVVKRLRRDKNVNGKEGQTWLDSENRVADYPPIRADQDTRIQGIVVGRLENT